MTDTAATHGAAAHGDDAPRRAVVIVNWNGREHLNACLESFRAQVDQNFDTIVVDNRSDDSSDALIRTKFPRVAVVQAGEAHAARDPIHDRHHVDAIRRVDRRDVERRWIARRSR